jgi:hypothetical protein
MEQKDARTSLAEAFSPDRAARTAATFNAFLSNIEAVIGKRCFRADDVERLAKIIVLSDVPGLDEALQNAVETAQQAGSAPPRERLPVSLPQRKPQPEPEGEKKVA